MTAELQARSIVGSYIIERELGRGGMGVVYLGVHQTLGKRAAIKVLLPQLSDRNDLIARFWAEAKAVTAVDHAGIVDVYDHGVTEDGRAFIVMEYLGGESLGARLKARGLLPIPNAVAIARQVANALAAAHAVGVVHRDLKPDNILLVPDTDLPLGERAKLLDFGVAKLAAPDMTGATKTITGTVLGTPHYMSPEQAEGASAVDHRSDLYSLGCTLFQMVSGRLPFESPGVGGLIGMHLHVPPPKLRDRAGHASQALEAIVARLLAKDPAARFQSGEELAAALADPAASEIDPAASAPLPVQRVTAEDATAVSQAPASRDSNRARRASLEEMARTIPAVESQDDDARTVPHAGKSTPRVHAEPTSARIRTKRLAFAGASLVLVAIAATLTYALSRDPDPPRTRVVTQTPDAAVVDRWDHLIDAKPIDPNDKLAIADHEFEQMRRAAINGEWDNFSHHYAKVEDNTREDSAIRIAADKEFDDSREHATAFYELRVAELVKEGACARASHVADDFVDMWGEEHAASIRARVKSCGGEVAATPITELFVAEKYAKVVERCHKDKPKDADLRTVCAIAACRIKNKNAARFFLVGMERWQSDRVLNTCNDLGQNLVEDLNQTK